VVCSGTYSKKRKVQWTTFVALFFQQKIPVGISDNFWWRKEQRFSVSREFPGKKRKASRGKPKFSELFSQKLPFHSIAVRKKKPELDTQLSNLTVFGISENFSQKVAVPFSLLLAFLEFWSNGRDP